ncbi:MAG: hypothetical protein ACRDRN_23525 [Sciscionella sp.]
MRSYRLLINGFIRPALGATPLAQLCWQGPRPFEQLYSMPNCELAAVDTMATRLWMGRLPEAWIAPPAIRELRALVRHRAKLVALRSSVKCQVHAVLAACGVPVVMSDLFGAGGQQLLQRVALSPAFGARVNPAGRRIDALDFEIELFTNLAGGRLRGHRGYAAIQAISGVGPILAAVFVAEIGQVHARTMLSVCQRSSCVVDV